MPTSPHMQKQISNRPKPSRLFSTTITRLNAKQEPPKTLGRHPRSITAPLAAFTMALLLGSYCVSSIRAARREARYHPPSSSSSSSSSSTLPSEESVAAGSSSGTSATSAAWITKALEEERMEKQGRNQRR